MLAPRWCRRCKSMRPWLKAGTYGKAVKLCGHCGGITEKNPPKRPKHRTADQQWSKAVRERDGHRCRRCGGPATDGGHIIRRAYMGTRHDPDNGLALCRHCHNYFGRHAEEWRAWLKANVPEVYARMTEQAGAPVR